MWGFYLTLLTLTATALAVTYEDDPAILANEREGQALLSQLNALLASAPASKASAFRTAARGAPGQQGAAGQPG